MAAGEQVILTSYSYRADAVLHRVIIDIQLSCRGTSKISASFMMIPKSMYIFELLCFLKTNENALSLTVELAMQKRI
jgi:hypothetical protein